MPDIDIFTENGRLQVRNRTQGSDESDFSLEETEYQCPNCRSERVTSVPMLYSSGTSKTEAFTMYVGNKKNYGVAPTYGMTQTLVARQLSPPQKRHPQIIEFIVLGFLLLGFGGFMVLLGGDALGEYAGLVSNLGIWSPILGVVLGIGGCVWSVQSTRKYNRLVWEPQYEQWQSSFVCQRCGTVFEP